MPAPPAWVSGYVGAPYLDLGRDLTGIDCLGLYLLVNRERRGLHLPDPYCTITGALRRGVVAQQRRFYELVTSPAEGDALLIRQRGFPSHVGYCINSTWMLHADRDMGVVAEQWSAGRWRNRVEGVYRWQSRANFR